MGTRYLLLFSRFERFWHWGQMLLILLLLASGFNIHGFYHLLDFAIAVELHTLSAIALAMLWIFAIFWHLTTGTWRHYIPSSEGLWRVIRFYGYDVFKGKPHPFRRAYWRKHNPLQALAYLALKLFLFPLIWISGIIYLFADMLGLSGSKLMLVASLHTAGAFAIVIFLIVHVYMLTIGGSFRSHLMPMLNGFGKVELTPEEEAYLEQDEPQHLR